MKKLDIPDETQLYSMYHNDMLNFTEIGKKFDVSYRTVSKWFDKLNIEKRNISQEQKNRFEKHNPQKNNIPYDRLYNLLVVEGLTIQEVATELDVSPEFIDKRKQEFGIYTGLRFSNTPSVAQNEIFHFLSEYVLCESNNRNILSNNKELDIWIPSLRIAIEYCGLFWHSEKMSKAFKLNFFNRNAHYNKYKECKDLGIQLITIFEDEWRDKKDILKSILLHKIKKSKIRIYARDCAITKIDPKIAKRFFDRTHIQGAPVWISDAYGLFHKQKMVACISYAKHHRNNNQIILNRMSFELNTSIVGGSSKLISNTIKEYNSDVFTWSDNRYSYGNIYEKLGFFIIHENKPDISYTDGYRRRGKQSMKRNSKDGWHRLWDCGKIKWSYKNV